MCGERQNGTRQRGSQRSCTTGTSTTFARPTGALNPKAAAGVDGVTWGAYDENLEANLQDLHRRLHSALGLASADAERWVRATTSALTGLSSSLNSSGAHARSRCERT